MKSISFIIPVYNEEKRLKKTFEALLNLKLPSQLKLEEVIFVNDGSTDKTKLKIESSKLKIEQKLKTKVQLISYEKNQGKGFAVKTGMLASTSEYSIFFDADISTPLSELQKLVSLMEKGTDVIVGTRKNGKSTVLIHQPKVRELLGRGFTQITKLALGLSGTDFTCGFKAFSKRAKDGIFTQSRISGWSYDAEIIFLAQKLNLSIKEKSVIWSNDKNTKVKLYKAIPQSFLDLATIQWYFSFKPFLLSLLPLGVESSLK